MDLLSSIRKSGSRGGVDFKWEDVSSSAHRENYLGHSLMAPVGRWQKGKDLTWYAKADSKDSVAGESAEEKRIRERKEEIRRIKEAEEDALAKALGLPVAPRGGDQATGANNIDMGEMKKMVKETEDQDFDEDDEKAGRGVGFGAFVGSGAADSVVLARANGMPSFDPEQGGLVGKDRKESENTRHERSRSRYRHERSRSGERYHHRRHRHRSRSREERRHRDRHDDDRTRERRHRSHSGERRDRRHRDYRDTREGRSRRDERERRRSPARRSRSPEARAHERGRDSDYRRGRSPERSIRHRRREGDH